MANAKIGSGARFRPAIDLPGDFHESTASMATRP
jgi:hypothetical protein